MTILAIVALALSQTASPATARHSCDGKGHCGIDAAQPAPPPSFALYLEADGTVSVVRYPDPPPLDPDFPGGGTVTACSKVCEYGACTATCVWPYRAQCHCDRTDGTPLCGCIER